MPPEIAFERRMDSTEVIDCLRQVTFRGLYDEKGQALRPYQNATFSMASVQPPIYPTSFPQIYHNLEPNPLFTSQPTIYKDQLDIIEEVDGFLQTLQKRIHSLGFEGIQYQWKDRGMFHVLPPVVEKQVYHLNKGTIDPKRMLQRFKGAHIKDARGNLHELSKRTLRDYYVDQESKVSYLDIFNHNLDLLNYGVQFDGPYTFYVICDGSHRLDYAIEMLNQPINVILVESEDLFPYYAFPVPFRPTMRLSSKDAEKMYPKLERDKIHLLNDMIKKVLHYNWKEGNLNVSSLRQQVKIH